MINEYIYKLCGLLKNETISVQSFTKQLGIENITDFTLPWHTLKIVLDGVEDLTIVNLPNTSLISHIRINLNNNADVEVNNFIEKLGMYQKLPKVDWKRPSELAFEVRGKINGFNGKIFLESKDYQDAESEFTVQAILIKP